MFYRRKVILALLQLFNGQLEKIRLQKLLFLFTQRQAKPEYDFIPYKYGCYSYSANADLSTMARKGSLTETDSAFISNEKTDYLKSLKAADRKLIEEIKSLYGNMNSNSLMKHTYLNYPFYAINSIKATDILTEEQLAEVINSKPNCDKTILFTIGYEGISLEAYLTRLLKHSVQVLVDVRNNPLSMKYGFSKSQLKKYCESLGIQYLHYPEVGIQSTQRRELNTQSDYDKLFATYRTENLLTTKPTQSLILNL